MLRRIFQCNVACIGGQKTSLLKVLVFLKNDDTVWFGDASGINSIEILYRRDLNIKISLPGL